MRYLLKEALKTLCGVNRWSYAVFWKIGCQNPKLLVWEECYHEPPSNSRSLEFSGNATLESMFHESQDGRSLHFLINAMMLNNHAIVLGEGLVGRAAFTGDYQWVLYEDFYEKNHHPEVQKVVFQQFLGGMQTVAVIPVLPHGVIQFGSVLTIPENVEFVNEVATMILHLGSLSRSLPSENSARNGYAPKLDNSVHHGDVTVAGSSLTSNIFNAHRHRSFDRMNCFPYSQPASLLDVPLSSELQSELLPDVALFSRHQEYPNISPEAKLECSSSNHVIDSSKMWMEQPKTCHASLDGTFGKIPADVNDVFACGPSSSAITSSDYMMKHESVPGMQSCNSVNVVQPTVNSFPSIGSTTKLDQREEFLSPNGLSASMVEMLFEESFAEPGFSDDLFDALGADFKKELLSGCWSGSLENEPVSNMVDCEYSQSFKQAMASLEGSDNGILSMPVTVSKVRMNSTTSKDLSSSCKTTMSCSFANNPSMSCCPSSEFSQGSSSVYGSQLISMLENNQKAARSNNVSTGYSKKPCDTGKTARKRLKPGENSRPRPKDRQMIQDRVKELREIVPNGAKCSIDSLLERTIKHMLFLQSVMKHADKLKQSGESKTTSKNGSLLSRNSFEGGATWAYKVGSQSMVPPIIVEDLHQPRQLRVEMLCEERGLFLEIADVIRGLGLTILKGVMETCNDKLWANFVVEANRDITRMEIFISLVHLLEQGAKSGVAQTNDISSTKNTNSTQFHSVAASAP